jgi:hypothetical protein
LETNLFPCFAISAADVNADGLKELFLSSEGLISSVNPATGEVEWQYECPFPEMSVYFITIGDADDDGEYELYGGFRQIALTCLNAQTGKQEWYYEFSKGSASWPPLICDSDDDGRKELIIGGNSIDVVAIDGKGKLDAKYDWPADISHWLNVPLDALDVNNDGKLELFLYSSFNNNTAGDLMGHQTAFVYCVSLQAKAQNFAPLSSLCLGSTWQWNNANDNDSDGLVNDLELSIGLNPDNADSDGDNMPDGWEANYNLKPLVNDAEDDEDGDGYTNLQEYEKESNPGLSDTDGDFIPDNLDWMPRNIFIPDVIALVLIVIIVCCCCRKR